jgi:hypothetical protein
MVLAAGEKPHHHLSLPQAVAQHARAALML